MAIAYENRLSANLDCGGVEGSPAMQSNVDVEVGRAVLDVDHSGDIALQNFGRGFKMEHSCLDDHHCFHCEKTAAANEGPTRLT